MDKYEINNQTFYRSVYKHINSNMFMLIANDEALVVDPHISTEMYDVLMGQNVNFIKIILTHEHHDHTSGVNWLKDNFKTTLVCHQKCAEYIAEERNNRPTLISFILEEQDRVNNTNFAEEFKQNIVNYSCKADVTFEKDFVDEWQGHKIEFISVPGHSWGSCLIVLDETFIFTGDTLLPNMPTITRFPEGNTKIFNTYTQPILKSLSPDLIVFPGHGEICKISEV